MKSKAIHLIAALSALGILAGCGATMEARRVKNPNESLIGIDYSMLHEGKSGEALKVYRSNEDLSSYNKLLIEPVLFAHAKDASQKDIDNLQKLANFFAGQIAKQLGNDYTLVKEPGPNTLRLQTAFYDPSRRKVLLNVVSSVMPMGVGLSVLKTAATGKPSAVGEVTAEAKLTDSVTGKIYVAGLDRRVGRKYTSGAFSSWGDVEEAFTWYAKHMDYRLCTMRRNAVCTEAQ